MSKSEKQLRTSFNNSGQRLRDAARKLSNSMDRIRYCKTANATSICMDQTDKQIVKFVDMLGGVRTKADEFGSLIWRRQHADEAAAQLKAQQKLEAKEKAKVEKKLADAAKAKAKAAKSKKAVKGSKAVVAPKAKAAFPFPAGNTQTSAISEAVARADGDGAMNGTQSAATSAPTTSPVKSEASKKDVRKAKAAKKSSSKPISPKNAAKTKKVERRAIKSIGVSALSHNPGSSNPY